MYGPKSLFKFGEKRPIVCHCTHEQKIKQKFQEFYLNALQSRNVGVKSVSQK